MKARNLYDVRICAKWGEAWGEPDWGGREGMSGCEGECKASSY